MKRHIRSVHCTTTGSDRSFATAASRVPGGWASDRWKGRAALKSPTSLHLQTRHRHQAAQPNRCSCTPLFEEGLSPLIFHHFFSKGAEGLRRLFGRETTVLSFLSLLVFTWSITMPPDFLPSPRDEWPSAIPQTARQLMPHNYSVDA